MKKTVCSIVSVFSIFSSHSLFAHPYCYENNRVILDGEQYIKVYVDPHDITISKESIEIQFDNELILTSSIYSDGEGVFFLTSSTLAWHCPFCDFPENPQLISCCSNCGTHR